MRRLYTKQISYIYNFKFQLIYTFEYNTLYKKIKNLLCNKNGTLHVKSCSIPCYMTCLITVWKINVIHNIMV